MIIYLVTADYDDTRGRGVQSYVVAAYLHAGEAKRHAHNATLFREDKAKSGLPNPFDSDELRYIHGETTYRVLAVGVIDEGAPEYKDVPEIKSLNIYEEGVEK